MLFLFNKMCVITLIQTKLSIGYFLPWEKIHRSWFSFNIIYWIDIFILCLDIHCKMVLEFLSFVFHFIPLELFWLRLFLHILNYTFEIYYWLCSNVFVYVYLVIFIYFLLHICQYTNIVWILVLYCLMAFKCRRCQYFAAITFSSLEK